MPPNDPTPGEIYQELLDKLGAAGADALAEEIERTVARGVVLTGQETPLYHSSSIYRPMEETEALAVAMEFFITACELPLMMGSANHTLESNSIEWRQERPGTERDPVSLAPAAGLDQQALRPLLMKILEIAHELGINLPEIA
jgi:hypothetical protein